MKKRILATILTIYATVFLQTAVFAVPELETEVEWTEEVGFEAQQMKAEDALLQMEAEDFAWNLDESTGTLTISGHGEMPGGTFSSPWASKRLLIKSVVIENGITSIGRYAFYNFTGLTSVTIPSTVARIDNSAFKYCNSLANITIPDSVTSIGAYAFSCCDSLTSITIPNSVEWISNTAFEYCDLLKIVVNKNNSYYSSDEFGVLFDKNKTTLIRAPRDIKEYVIPNSVTCIDDYAFSLCRSLTNITIPDSVTSIGDYAFEMCYSLKTGIALPNSVVGIGDYAFNGCYLTDITIPDSVGWIGDRAFGSCWNLTKIVVNNNNPYYSSDEFGVLFDKNKTTLIQAPGAIENCVIPDSVTSITEGAFESCHNLTDLTIPNGVTSIEERTFWYCNSLTSITIPNSVTSIGENTFAYCESLTSITIPDSVTSINGSAFRGCDSLTSITIPDSVTSIGEWTFSLCRSLTNITIPDGVTSIGRGTFYDCYNLTDVYYTGSESEWNDVVIETGGNDFLLDATIHYNCNLAADFAWNLSDDGTLTISGHGDMPDYDTVNRNNPPWYDEKEQIINVVITDGITKIGNDVFSGCKHMTEITIPDSVKRIGSWAFEACKELESISIPNGVTKIDEGAFAGCESLTNIILPQGLTFIDEYVFWLCVNLKNIVVPDSVAWIGHAAFHSCSGFSDIFYTGSESDWNNIRIEMSGVMDNDDGAMDALLNATVHYNSPNAKPITVLVNSTPVSFPDQQPFIKDSRTLVPARGVFEALGATVSWDGTTKTVSVLRGNTLVTLTIGQSYITVNGAVKAQDVPAQLISDRTMIPVRSVAEAFGCSVGWDGNTYTVSIDA